MFKVDWVTVKAFGNLALLSRVSYASLFLVPVIARLWDRAADVTVQLSLGSAALRDDLERLAASTIALESSSPPEALAALDGVQGFGRNLLAQLEQANAVVQSLPPELTLTFFAALFVVFGQVIYQVFCHDIIRRYKIDEFGNHEQQRYSDSPSRSQLEGALNHLKRSSKYAPLWLLAEVTVADIQSKGAEDQQSIVRLGALAAFEAMAAVRPNMAFLSLASYLGGVTLLVVVLLLQIAVVLGVS